jgi:RNA polymerase sigma-70 factor, ECF subfamily
MGETTKSPQRPDSSPAPTLPVWTHPLPDLRRRIKSWASATRVGVEGSSVDYVQLSDEELVDLVSEGETAAFEAIYEKYSGAAYALAVRMLGDSGAAEEVVQDAFVSLWKKSATYDPGQGKLYTWLLRITRNRAIDEMRKRSSPARDAAKHRRLYEETRDFSGSSGDTGAEAALVSELRGFVREAMDELPEEQRQVVELSYLGGLSQREISERTGVPLGTVKTRSRLALKKLRLSLEPVIGKTVDLDGI